MSSHANSESDSGGESAIQKCWLDATSVRVSGSKVAEFLQGYLTVDTERAATNRAIPMALCDLKGRVVVSGWFALEEDGDALLIVHKSLASKLQNLLAPYARFSQCSLAVMDAPVIVRPGAGDIADHWQLVRSAAGPDAEQGGGQGLADASFEINAACIDQMLAWVTEATSGRFLPQALALQEIGAVDFDKGCYLGQEIVARAQFRGAVKKQLRRFEWSDQVPEVGAKNADNEVVIAVTQSPSTSSKGLGLSVG